MHLVYYNVESKARWVWFHNLKITEIDINCVGCEIHSGVKVIYDLP